MLKGGDHLRRLGADNGDNIKVDNKEIYYGVDWIPLAGSCVHGNESWVS
jgi:hypothetical protein